HTDITERKQAEEALRRSQRGLRGLYRITTDQHRDFAAKVRALLEFGCDHFGLPVGVLVRTGTGRVEIVEAVGAGAGMARGRILPLPPECCGEVLDHGPHMPMACPLAWKITGMGVRTCLDARVSLAEREWGVLAFLSERLGDPAPTDHELVKLMALWIGGELARLEVERDLRQAKDLAELANRSKSEFLATMSHELRTPLNAVIGFSEMMAAEIFGPLGAPQYSEYVHNVIESGQHLLEVINDILDVSKIEAGQLILHDEELAVPRLLDSVLRLIGARAEAASLALSCVVAPDLPPLKADERRVKQILLNLLSNAVKFTPAGGRVSVTAGLDEAGALAIAVADTGIGMAPEDIPKAMAAFGQVDSRLARKHEGTGLGLPLTRSLVELHGGRLNLVSAPGEGTTVTVVFPRERVMVGETAAFS
ncbi:MAG: histidine kinase, partial [Rhodospirillales bacterium]|nr:histidine kinase [Rhodospirillales bacterium]